MNKTNFGQPYLTPTISRIFLLGFSSGLPFLLTLATLHIWLTEANISKTTIGLFALVTIPYSFKFIWAPIIDKYCVPFLANALGHKKSWMLCSQIMIVIFLLLLGRTNPEIDIYNTAICAFIVAFFSAIQDIVIESYRVEKLAYKDIGFGAGASNLGYRLGMWVSGAGALYIASFFDWQTVYTSMALCMIIGIITTLLIDEPKIINDEIKTITLNNKSIAYIIHKIYAMVEQSVKSLHNRQDFSLIILYIFFFKAIDTSLNIMANPFLLEIGFNKIEIAHIGKSFGISAMIVGGLLSGILLAKYRMQTILILCTTLQMVSSGAFLLQNNIGKNLYCLTLTVGIENLVNGIGAAAFIAYLSVVCKQHNTGSIFALLTSIASLARVIFSYIAGWCADVLSWNQYFVMIAIICTPMITILILTKKINN